MVEGYMGPSELHLKRELTALTKSRFLRDPETCSSWRSPLSSKSFAASSSVILNGGHSSKLNATPKSNMESLPLPPPGGNIKNKRKKVYLYNWRQNSNKSSDSGLKSGEGTTEDEEEESESKSDTCLDVPVNIYNVTGSNSETPVRRTVRRVRRNNKATRKGAMKKSTVSKLLDLPSSSLAIVNSAEQSDDTENCNKPGGGYFSRSASPFFSGSCGSWSNAAKILRNIRREGSSLSCTPASTSSYYLAGASFDGEELERNKGCGIPCYWSKRVNSLSHSPSLSDTLRRKGGSILCRGHAMYSNSNSKKRPASSNNRKNFKNFKNISTSPVLPLLSNGNTGSPFDSEIDEISTNFGELDLEAVSRLDGRRWSTSCKSMEITTPGTIEPDLPDQRSLSQKYRPRVFEEIIGQNIVAQSLSNAITRGKIAPAYLFQGPRGTGKTCTARIFAAALCCTGPAGEPKPCRSCKECTENGNGIGIRNGTNLIVIDATNKKGINKVRHLVRNIPADVISSRYMVFVIDECHMVSAKMWSAFIKLLDEPMPRVVFIFVTIDPDNLPRAIVSRCQRYIFSKVKEADIVCRLRRIAAEERLDAELDALDLIALNSDGSLRDAETMLDQLSLLGKKITASLVNDLVGVVSDEKLLDLLEIALSSDTAETVKRSRELMDSGVDPMALMSQLAGLIMDIIAGTYRLANSRSSGTALGGRRLTEAELERLQQALKILSDAEKQIRLSSERSTWFTAALLQLGGTSLSDTNQSRSSSSKHSARTATNNNNNNNIIINNTDNNNNNSSSKSNKKDLSVESARTSNCSEKRGNEWKLVEIWRRCIERCHSKTLRQLLSDHARLVSIRENEGVLITFISFEDNNIKSRAERFLSSITDSIESVLKHTVQVRIGLIPEPSSVSGSRSEPGSSSSDRRQQPNPNHKRTKLPAVNDEQKLENAWLQAAALKPEKNQVLPSAKWEELSHEMKALKLGERRAGGVGEVSEENGYVISPSLLHSRSYVEKINKENMGYESGPGCNGLLCWRTQKPRSEVKREAQVRPNKSSGPLSFFGPCAKSKVSESRLKN